MSVHVLFSMREREREMGRGKRWCAFATTYMYSTCIDSHLHPYTKTRYVCIFISNGCTWSTR